MILSFKNYPSTKSCSDSTTLLNKKEGRLGRWPSWQNPCCTTWKPKLRSSASAWKAGYGGASLKSQCWGGQDRIAGAPCPAILAKRASFRSCKRLCLKYGGEGWLRPMPKVDLRSPHMHTRPHIHLNTHTHTRTGGWGGVLREEGWRVGERSIQVPLSLTELQTGFLPTGGLQLFP